MSDHIDTREGWRIMLNGDQNGERVIHVHEDGTATYWIREEPVPPLPIEPGYYRAEAPQYGGTVVVELLHSPQGQWVDSGDREYLTPDDVRALGPLVLLETRAVTAKAVLDEAQRWLGDRDAWPQIAAKFGVEL